MNVLSIQSTVAYGRVGQRAAVLPLERLGHDVWPLDTVAYSNHPGHGRHRGRVVPAPAVAELLAGLADLGVLARCDAVLSGYLGEAETARVVAAAVRRVREANPAALYCCDPVIGEVGRGTYVAEGVAEALRDDLVPLADVVRANPFELEWLTGLAPRSSAAALAAADALRARGPRLVVATGLRLPDAAAQQLILATDADAAWQLRMPHRPVRVHGTGDAFTALLLGALLCGQDARAAVEHAAAAVDAALAVAEARGADELPLVAAQDALAQPPIRHRAERIR